MRQSTRNNRLRWSAASLGTVLLMVWNARLVVSAGSGLGTMVLMYLMQDETWRSKWQNSALFSAKLQPELQQRIAQWNRPFVWSAIAGGGAAFFSYLALSAWMETEAHWLATGILIQGLMTFGLLGLMLKQMGFPIANSTAFNPTNSSESIQPEAPEVLEESVREQLTRWAQQLSHSESTARLLAVRELTAIAMAALEPNALESSWSSFPSIALVEEILDYLQLVARQDAEPIVQAAAQRGIQAIAPSELPQSQLAPSSFSASVQPRKIAAMLESESPE